MNTIKENVFVLGSVAYRDSDLVVNFLSAIGGRLSAVIYRGRKLGSASSFTFHAGDLIELEYKKSETRDFIRVENTAGLNSLNADSFSFQRFLFHSYLIELVSKIAKPELSAEELFFVLSENNRISWSKSPPWAFMAWCLWKVIKFGGFEIDFSACSHCQKPSWIFKEKETPSFRKQYYHMAKDSGRMICGDCVTVADASELISPAMIKLLWLNEGSQGYNKDYDQLPPSVVIPLIKILNEYLLRCYEIKPRSLPSFSDLIDSSLSKLSEKEPEGGHH